MKKLLSLASAVLIIFTLLPFLPSPDDLSLYDNVIRLHILANSDSTADQALKLFVRDRVLTFIDSLIADAETKEDAEAAIQSSLDEISVAVSDAVSEYGADSSVSVTLSTEEYPRRTYGFVTLPSGNYTSLRIMLGEAEGANWWCVLFPRLCTSLAISGVDGAEEEFIEVGFTPSQYRIITEADDKRYVIKFRIIEIFEELFG